MKNILFILALLISFSSFSQSPMTPSQLGMKDKTYKKIVKKLDLRIINRGYYGKQILNIETANNKVNSSRLQFSSFSSHPAFDYIKLWRDVFFELGIGTSSKARWTFMIEKGGYNGMILEGNTMVVKFTTKEKMFLNYSNSKRRAEFINFAKVVFNEILKSAR